MSDAAEEPAKPAAPAGAPAKTSKAVLALLVLNLGASGFGVFKLLTTPPASAAVMKEPPHETNEKIEVTGPVIALDPFVVNLNEPGNPRYLKVTMQAELVTKDAQELIEKNKQVIRDAVLSYLSGLKLADTLGAEAKETMRKETLKKLEEIVGEHKVRRLFFQEFVVQ
ncbi:MAG TPA: flagellar basal body-associated FliL family protein [Kofleriaceae bacterium]|jgi:flagellar basal body-associated protein FliL